MDKRFRRLVDDMDDEASHVTILSDIRKLRDNAFVERIKSILKTNVDPKKARWTSTKLRGASMQCQDIAISINMPTIAGVDGIVLNVLMSIPGSASPLLVEYNTSTIEYLYKVAQAQRDMGIKTEKDNKENDIGIPGISKSKYGGSSLRCRRKSGGKWGRCCYIKYSNDDEYVSALKKARIYVEGTDAESGALQMDHASDSECDQHCDIGHDDDDDRAPSVEDDNRESDDDVPLAYLQGAGGINTPVEAKCPNSIPGWKCGACHVCTSNRK